MGALKRMGQLGMLATAARTAQRQLAAAQAAGHVRQRGAAGRRRDGRRVLAPDRGAPPLAGLTPRRPATSERVHPSCARLRRRTADRSHRCAGAPLIGRTAGAQ